MKRIFFSLIIIAVISLVGFGVTQAFFTDTETKTGNTFSTGTIDIAADWDQVAPFELKDMKPSQTDYINFTVHNTGTNPVNLYKTLKNFQTADGSTTPAEILAEGIGTPKNDVDKVVNYDLRVELYNGDPKITESKKVWWETIYMDADGVTLDSLENKPIYLGMIPENWYLKVTQSYHMPGTTGNEYQGDKLTFDIVLDAEQLGKSDLVLENKVEVNGDISHTLLSDSKYATLSYKVKEDKFDYTFKVFDWTDGNYTLISYVDPWPGSGSLALANIVVSSGTANVTGNIDINQDLINAKVWLVPGTFTPGQLTGSLTWDPNNTLFETGLMDYYDPIK